MAPINGEERDGLLSLEEAAQRLGIASVTLRLWTYRGKVGFVRLGRRKLFNPEELARVVRENTVPATQKWWLPAVGEGTKGE